MSSLTTAEARDQMLQVLKDIWNPLYPMLYSDTVQPDSQGEAPSGPVWGRATIRHADAGQASLTGPLEGLKRYRREGTLHIQIFTPVGDGGTAAYDVADEVAKAYEGARLPNLWFRDVRQHETDNYGPFTQIKVLVTFTYDTVR